MSCNREVHLCCNMPIAVCRSIQCCSLSILYQSACSWAFFQSVQVCCLVPMAFCPFLQMWPCYFIDVSVYLPMDLIVSDHLSFAILQINLSVLWVLLWPHEAANLAFHIGLPLLDFLCSLTHFPVAGITLGLQSLLYCAKDFGVFCHIKWPNWLNLWLLPRIDRKNLCDKADRMKKGVARAETRPTPQSQASLNWVAMNW